MPQLQPPRAAGPGSPSGASPRAGRGRWYRQLYLWVLLGIAAGIVVGIPYLTRFDPEAAYFRLVVDPAGDLQVPVWPQPREVGP